MRVAIGDIHGRDTYKQFIKDSHDEVYFLGDYFDTHEGIGPGQQLDNFAEIVELAKKDSRVHLCLGNHDYHYILNDRFERYSGFQEYHRFDIREALKAAEELFSVVFKTEDNFLLSHAGVSKTFLASCNLTDPLEINQRYKEFPELLMHYAYGDPYGDHPMNSPIWIRPRALFGDMLDGYTQIVGHTQTQFGEIKTIERDSTTKLVMIDTGLKAAFEF